MKYVRLFTLWLATILLSGGLSLLLSGWVFNATLADRNVVKSWITSSGIYDGFVDEVVSSSLDEVVESDQSIDTALLQTAANQAFSPELLQSSAESVLDGIYDWLDGSNDSVEFTLDLTEAKTNYASELASQAELRIEELPACSQSQLATINTVDPLSLACAPPTFIYQPAIAQLQQELLTSGDFLPNPIITASDIGLPLAGEEKTIEDALPHVPFFYQLLRAGVFIAVGIIVLSIGVLVLLSHDKLAVLRRVAKSLLAAAITAGMMTGLLYYLIQTTGSTSVTTLAERVTDPLITVIANDVIRISWVFTIIYLFLAIDCYIAYRLFNKRRHTHSAT